MTFLSFLPWGFFFSHFFFDFFTLTHTHFKDGVSLCSAGWPGNHYILYSNSWQPICFSIIFQNTKELQKLQALLLYFLQISDKIALM